MEAHWCVPADADTQLLAVDLFGDGGAEFDASVIVEAARLRVRHLEHQLHHPVAQVAARIGVLSRHRREAYACDLEDVVDDVQVRQRKEGRSDQRPRWTCQLEEERDHWSVDGRVRSR